MVDAFSNQFQNFLGELGNITSKGAYNVQPKLKPVKPKQLNFSMPGLVSSPGMANNSSSGGGGSELDRLIRAIRGQESGGKGNYSAYNGLYGASGAYQILPSNWTAQGTGWDMDALGRDVSYDEFMRSPQIQDAIARHRLNIYLQKYGAAGAAVAWYGGPGAVKNMYSKTKQAGGYPSLYEYWKSVLSKM